MRKIRTVAAAVLSGAALLLYSPAATAAEPLTSSAPPVDVDLEIEVLDDNAGLLLPPGAAVPAAPEPGLG